MSDDQDRLQLRAAAQGCVSGEAHEWPMLSGALRRLGYPVDLNTPALELKKMAQDALEEKDPKKLGLKIHGPLPWRVSYTYKGVVVGTPNRRMVVNVGSCHPATTDTAHLISAAPDLFEALESLRDWQTTAPQEIIDAADAALAKAKGEQR